MHSIDRKGRLLEVSDFWSEVLGYKRDEVIGTKLTQYSPCIQGALQRRLD
jgi:PAS domain S-box-containing protein